MTTRTGLVRWPDNDSSLSPQIHNAAYRALNLDWAYSAFPISPDNGVEGVHAELRALWAEGDVRGLSVTMPHKVVAMDICESLSPAATEIGAINTLIRTPDGWRGDNTDGPGFATYLSQDLGYAIQGKKVGMIGAGGAAAAIAWAIKHLSSTAKTEVADLYIWNRTPEKARDLAKQIGVGSSCEWTELAECDLIISCVPAAFDWPDRGDNIFRQGQTLIDLTYVPEVTPLMEAAADSGAQTHNGLGFLLRQAELQFEVWTGKEAPYEAMRVPCLG